MKQCLRTKNVWHSSLLSLSICGNNTKCCFPDMNEISTVGKKYWAVFPPFLCFFKLFLLNRKKNKTLTPRKERKHRNLFWTWTPFNVGWPLCYYKSLPCVLKTQFLSSYKYLQILQTKGTPEHTLLHYLYCLVPCFLHLIGYINYQ